VKIDGAESNEVGFGEKAFVFGVTRGDLHNFTAEKFHWLMDTIARIAEARYGTVVRPLSPAAPRGWTRQARHARQLRARRLGWRVIQGGRRDAD
jgi:hypothetical protein